MNPMINIFTRSKQYTILPKKRYFWLSILLLGVISLLYIVSAVLYFSLNHANDNTAQCLLFSCTIAEIMITALSIVISLIVAYISNCISNACIKSLEDMHKNNKTLFDDTPDLKDASERLHSQANVLRWLTIGSIIIFILYCVAIVSYNINIHNTIIQWVTLIINVLSIICTILLSLISCFSSFMVGGYMQIIMNILKNENKELFNKYNMQKIIHYNDNHPVSPLT